MIEDAVAVAHAHPPRYLLAYSSGCLVAARIAREMPIAGTLCVAPVFDYADTETNVDE